MVSIPTSVNLPQVDLTGFFSSTWIYVFMVFIVGVIAVVGLGMYLFYKTYNRKVVFFENISGQGFQPIAKKRARIIKLGTGGTEILKVMGGDYVTAYGRKMGKRTYWFAKGEDGYWYNITLGDLDTKMSILDVEPVEKDVRMFHAAKDRMAKSTYGKESFMQRYGTQVIALIMLVVVILGIWFIVGKIGDATQALSETAETNAHVAEQTSNALNALANIQKEGKDSGIVKTNLTGGG